MLKTGNIKNIKDNIVAIYGNLLSKNPTVIYKDNAKIINNLEFDKNDILELLKYDALDEDDINKYFSHKKDEVRERVGLSNGNVIYEDNIMPIPSINKRNVISIFGSSGSGKSVFTNNFCVIYQHLFPNNEIYMISSKPEDPSITFEPKRLNIPRIVEDDVSLDWKKFANSLIVIDDSFFEKEEQAIVDKFMNDVIFLGRQQRTSIIITKHILNNGQDTRILKCESDMIVVFPNHSPRNHIIDYLKNIGFTPTTARRAINTNSRFLCIRIQAPNVLIYNDKVEIY